MRTPRVSGCGKRQGATELGIADLLPRSGGDPAARSRLIVPNFSNSGDQQRRPAEPSPKSNLERRWFWVEVPRPTRLKTSTSGAPLSNSDWTRERTEHAHAFAPRRGVGLVVGRRRSPSLQLGVRRLGVVEGVLER